MFGIAYFQSCSFFSKWEFFCVSKSFMYVDLVYVCYREVMSYSFYYFRVKIFYWNNVVVFKTALGFYIVLFIS